MKLRTMSFNILCGKFTPERIELVLEMVEKYNLKYEPFPTLICPRTKKPLDMGYDKK